jgi:hypothetical protein
MLLHSAESQWALYVDVPAASDELTAPKDMEVPYLLMSEPDYLVLDAFE